MRKMLSLVAGCCLLGLVACSSNNPPSTGSVNPGVVSDTEACPSTCTSESASPGAVKSDCGACPYSGQSGSGETSLGAVGGSECSGAKKSSCCPSTSTEASPGAVKDKDACCPSTSTEASPGAVKDEGACCPSSSKASDA